MFSGKLTTNKPSPDKGSFLSGNCAFALFSGGSVRSVDGSMGLIQRYGEDGKENCLTVARGEAAVHAILNKDSYGGHKFVVVECDQIVEYQETHHDAGFDETNAATPSEYE